MKSTRPMIAGVQPAAHSSMKALLEQDAPGAQGPSAPTSETQVPSHHATQKRPLTAPGIRGTHDIFSEQPSATYAVQKNRALDEMRRLAAQSSGTAQEILAKMAEAAARTQHRLQAEFRCHVDPRHIPQDEVTGRVERRVFRGRKGETKVRMVFTPDDRRQGSVWLSIKDTVGIPNGAPVVLRPGRGEGVVVVEPKTKPAPNMAGRLTTDEHGRLVVQALSPLSPYDSVIVNEHDAPKLRKLLESQKGDELMVLVDLDHKTRPPQAIFHDFLKANPLQLLELDAALSAGLAGTFDVAELVQAEQIASSDPLKEIPPELRDERAEIDIATDNEGSHTDFISEDPEQAATVIDAPDRYILKYKLAYSRPLVPPKSPIAVHGADNPQTFYGSGFDLPAHPRAINMDKAVLLEGKARYAVTVECHIDKVTGQPILDDCGAYETVVQNDWQGSYRKAQVYYELQRDDLTPERRAELEAVMPDLGEGIREQLDLARAAHRVIRKGFIEDGGLLVGNRDGYESEDIIHSFSTTANEVLGYLLFKAKAPAVNRVHGEGRTEQFATFTREIGVPWYPAKETLAEYLRDLPNRVPQDRPNLAEVIGRQAIRFTSKAEYSSHETGHFGMGKAYYAHGSASNRLVSGLVNLANAVAATKLLAGENVEFPYSKAQAERFADRQTEIQTVIDNVEQEQHSIRDAIALQDFVGANVSARVHDVSSAGLTFQLLEPEARVFIPMSDLKQALQTRYEFEDPITLLMGKHRFAIGDEVSLRIEAADPHLHRVQAMLAEVPPGWADWS